MRLACVAVFRVAQAHSRDGVFRFYVGVESAYQLGFRRQGVVPSSLYDWGVAKWVYIAASVIAIAGAVWLLAVKVKEKRALKAGGVR